MGVGLPTSKLALKWDFYRKLCILTERYYGKLCILTERFCTFAK